MQDELYTKAILNSIDSIIYVSDIDTHEVLYLNAAGKKALHLKNDEYKGKKCYKLLQGYDKPCPFCTNEKLLKYKQYRWSRFNKLLNTHFSISDHLIEVSPGYFVRMEVAVDITDDEKQKQRLGNKIDVDETLLKCIRTLSEINDMKSAIDKLLNVIAEFYDANRAYIFEFDVENGIIHNTYEWCAEGVSEEIDNLQNVPLYTIDNWVKQFKKNGSFCISSLNQEIDPTTEEYQILNDQGIESLIAAPLYENDKISGFIGVDDPQKYMDNRELLKSITYFITNDIQKRHLITKLEYLSYIDILTGLYNRNKYMRKLFEFEKKGAYKLGVIYIDLNGLKLANNQYGHEYGDQLIRNMAEMIKKVFKGNAYRIGGDEFVVLCSNIDYIDFEDKVLELRTLVDSDEKTSASIGATWEEEIHDINKLIKHADELMYANKQYYYRYTSHLEYNHDSAIAKEIIDEIANNRYHVYLQPKVDLKTGEVNSAEALIRKIDETGSIIAPDHFIPLYESEGVIRHIDFFVLEEVCKLLQKLKQFNLQPIKISVNFSRATLMEYNIIDKMSALCERYQVNPSQICIEVTESVSKLKTDELIAFAKELKRKGFFLSLDDYGANYSNISILTILDFDEIKIDRSIISNLAQNEKTKTIVRSIILMCKNFNKTNVVAEGIEKETELMLLKEFDCDLGQGYYFSKPVPIEQFVKQYL